MAAMRPERLRRQGLQHNLTPSWLLSLQWAETSPAVGLSAMSAASSERSCAPHEATSPCRPLRTAVRSFGILSAVWAVIYIWARRDLTAVVSIGFAMFCLGFIIPFAKTVPGKACPPDEGISTTRERPSDRIAASTYRFRWRCSDWLWPADCSRFSRHWHVRHSCTRTNAAVFAIRRRSGGGRGGADLVANAPSG